ncbi:MAG: HlyC/CorC family transporter [Halothiobacillaceae bacterium]
MSEIPLAALFGALAFLLVLSAFFSSSETGLMALNRYRLRHLAREGHAGAARAQRLLERPDRLIGMILLGNNFVNILASAIATVIGLRLFGDSGIAIATGAMTFLVLIFGEVAPKTAAALHPERIAFPAATIYSFLIGPLMPVIRLINLMANALLRLVRIDPNQVNSHALSAEELRTVVRESGHRLDTQHREMLMSVLELEEVTVEDIMVPRSDTYGIDLDEDWNTVLDKLRHSPFSRLPVFHGDLDNVVGSINLRRLFDPLVNGTLTPQMLKQLLREPYFIPEGTPLTIQLLNFQRLKRRAGLVVDEYGDVLGLVTLEDILEEIVGEFTTSPETGREEVTRQTDGSFVVSGAAAVREINRELGIELPTEDVSTINGLVMEYLETLPTVGASITLDNVRLEVLTVKKRAVDKALIRLESEPAET